MHGSDLLGNAVTVLLSGFEFGLLNALMVVGIAIAFRFANFPDLTLEGTVSISAAVSAAVTVSGFPPIVAVAIGGMLGALAGSITATLRLATQMSKLLAGIVTMTILYALSLRVMGGSNLPMFGSSTLYVAAHDWFHRNALTLMVVVPCLLLVCLFLHTECGILLRACGENEQLVGKLQKRVWFFTIIALAIANAMTGISGALMAQYNQFADVGFSAGALISSLAALLLGEAVVYPTTVFRQILAAVIGSIVYSTIFSFALKLGLHPWDLRLASALFVLAVIVMSKSARTGIQESRRIGSDPL